MKKIYLISFMKVNILLFTYIIAYNLLGSKFINIADNNLGDKWVVTK